MRTIKDDWRVTHQGMKLFLVMAIMALLCFLASPGRLFSRGSEATQTVSFHSPLLKNTTMYLFMERYALTLHVHNGTDRAISQARIELIAYWRPKAGAGQAKRQMDFDNKYLLVCARPSGIAPHSDGVLTVDWDSDVKAGTKDDPIVPTKVLHEGYPVFLYGNDLGDQPTNVQAWLQNEMVEWKGVSVTFMGAPPTPAKRPDPLLTPLHEGQRPKRLTFTVSGFDVRKLLDYHIKSTDSGCGSIAYYDPIHRYYLFMERDGLGEKESDFSLWLMPKSEWNGFLNSDAEPPTSPSKVIRKHLSCVTDTGVRIGDSFLAVLRTLGRATYITPGDELEYDYEGGHLNGWSYMERYEFKHGRLNEIVLDMQNRPYLAG